MGHLWDALYRAYDALGFPQATGGDEVFRQLVLARIIEPASKQDSLRVLEEAGAPAPSYPTLNRRLPAWAEDAWRQGLSEACAAHARLGPASLVLYDVSTLYFEADRPGWRGPHRDHFDRRPRQQHPTDGEGVRCRSGVSGRSRPQHQRPKSMTGIARRQPHRRRQ
jgi:hypothetical protein